MELRSCLSRVWVLTSATNSPVAGFSTKVRSAPYRLRFRRAHRPIQPFHRDKTQHAPILIVDSCAKIPRPRPAPVHRASGNLDRCETIETMPTWYPAQPATCTRRTSRSRISRTRGHGPAHTAPISCTGRSPHRCYHLLRAFPVRQAPVYNHSGTLPASAAVGSALTGGTGRSVFWSTSVITGGTDSGSSSTS